MTLKHFWRRINGIDEIPQPIRDHQGYNAEDWWIDSALILDNNKYVRLRFDNGIIHLWKLESGTWTLVEVGGVPYRE